MRVECTIDGRLDDLKERGHVEAARGEQAMVAYVQDLSPRVLVSLANLARHLLNSGQYRLADTMESLRDQRGANRARRITGLPAYRAACDQVDCVRYLIAVASFWRP